MFYTNYDVMFCKHFKAGLGIFMLPSIADPGCSYVFFQYHEQYKFCCE